MAITIKLNPEIEEKLRKLANNEGTNLSKFISKFIEKQFPKKQDSRVSKEEADLLKKINLGFSNDFWKTYKILVQKRQREEISEPELKKLIQMTHELEIANAERIKNLVALSKIRGISLEELMSDLGITPIGHG